MVGERMLNPLAAMARALELSRNAAWPILIAMIILFVGIWFSIQLIGLIGGILGVTLLGEEGRLVLTALVGALSTSIFTLVWTFLAAAVYRLHSASSNGM